MVQSVAPTAASLQHEQGPGNAPISPLIEVVQAQSVGGAVFPGERRFTLDRSPIRQVLGTVGQRIAIVRVNLEIATGIGMVQCRDHEPG